MGKRKKIYEPTTFSIDASLKKEFEQTVISQFGEQKKSAVLRILMQAFIDGKIKIVSMEMLSTPDL